MSLSQNLQNILDETLQSFLSIDPSSNIYQRTFELGRANTTVCAPDSNVTGNLVAESNGIPFEFCNDIVEQWNQIYSNSNNPMVNTQETIQEETDSLPDLIPIEEPPTEPREFIDDNTRRIRLWSNILLDYHNQINTYQENMRTILTITENILPISETRNRNIPYSSNTRANPETNTRANDRTNFNSETSRLLQSFLNNSPSYILELDATNLWNTNRNRTTPTGTSTSTSQRPRPTALQIQTATTVFYYNSQENLLPITICPITLEEFQEGEMLMRIHGCGHIFKAIGLHRWFERNHKCPSCRYDITTAAPAPAPAPSPASFQV
jgi:hypothetical protein